MQIVFKITYYLFITLIIAVALLLAASALPITGNYQIKIVQSGSMEPAVSTGAVVIIRPAPNYQVGDIITFGPDTKTKAPTTHRITKVRATEGTMLYTTKGDANDSDDQTEVRARDIIGKVLFSVPYAGFILDFAKKPVGFILIIVVPALIIVGDEARKIVVEAKRIREKKKNYDPEQESDN